MQNQQVKMNLSLSQTTEMVCEKCENKTFKEVLFIRKASKFLTGQPQDSLIPIPVFACDSCGHVNSDLQPKEMQEASE